MSQVIVLSERDNSTKYPIDIVKRVFVDWDFATLCCAQKNANSDKNLFYYLNEIPFEGEVTVQDCDISRSGEEIIISYLFGEVYATIKLEEDFYEEWHHEEVPPKTMFDLKVASITIENTDIKDLNLSKELVRKIEHEADNYKNEKVQEYYDRE